MQNKLRALGITTFADLAAANPDKLMAQLKGSQPLSLGGCSTGPRRRGTRAHVTRRAGLRRR